MRRERVPPQLCSPTERMLGRLALLLAFLAASLGTYRPTFAVTNQVVLFTGFLAGANAGMDFLNAELATVGIPDYLGQVFEWSEQELAFDWIQQQASDRATLVLIGHSFGGHSTLQVANNYLHPLGVRVDLTIQIDSVTNFDGGTNNQLPTNVDVGINYYQISTGFLEPQGEDFVQGATNINTEVLFGDTTISHTSIDNDPRLHDLIGQNILDNLNQVDADFDADGDVDGRDLLLWQRGGSPTPLSAADLMLWQSQYGAVPLSAGAQAVPEPSTLVLLGGLAVIALHGRRFVAGTFAELNKQAVKSGRNS